MNGQTHPGRAWTIIWAPHTKGSAILLHVEIALGALGPSMGRPRGLTLARWCALVGRSGEPCPHGAHTERKGGDML